MYIEGLQDTLRLQIDNITPRNLGLLRSSINKFLTDIFVVVVNIVGEGIAVVVVHVVYRMLNCISLLCQQSNNIKTLTHENAETFSTNNDISQSMSVFQTEP